ncbi:hypothetical protein OAP83_00205 [Rickettsiales bacterium]|nr:hypothetical protein [Rickettsiales bacterium]
MRLLHKITFKKFVVLIGDNFSKLILFNRKTILDEITITDIDDKDQMKQVVELFKKGPNLPIYVLANISEQSFEPISIPSTNPFLFSKLITRKTAVDKGKESVIKGYFKVNTKQKSKNTDCVIIKIPVVSPLENWLAFLKNVPNIIRAVYSFPVEMQGFAADVNRFFNLTNKQDIDVNKKERKFRLTKNKDSEANTWSFYVFQSETSGIRFAITKNNDLIFTRLLHYHCDNNELSEDKIKIIKNEILGTIEYLKRLDYNENEKISIFLLTDNAFQTVFKTFDLSQNFIFVDLNLFGKFIFKDIANIDYDNSPDKLFMHYFVDKGHFNGLLPKDHKKEAILYENNMIANVAMVFVVTIILIVSSLPLIQIAAKKQNIDNILIDRQRFSKQLETIREEKFGFDIDEDKVIDVASLHEKLLTRAQDPIDLLYKFNKFVPNNIVISDIDWQEHKETQMKLVVSANFKSDGLSFEEIFSAYDSFLRSIRKGFPKYEIDHSDLPDTISFERSNENLPINIQIVGPVR